jgi:hypothetical protein
MNFKYKYVYYIIIILLLYILYYLPEYYVDAFDIQDIADLKHHGFCILNDARYSEETVDYPCEKLVNDVLSKLPPDYVFINYVYKINNVALSTFHRDVTSSKHLHQTTHPVYTLILYKYDGELLSLCPRSHDSYPFVFSHIININGEAGNAFLFDSDLLHAGRLNKCRERNVVQFKICHKDDLHKLQSLQNVYMEKTEKCENTSYVNFMRKCSYYFEFPINYIAYPLMIKREDKNSLIGAIQSYIPIQYYNNSY